MPRNGGSSGCVEVGAFGKENYNLTGYFNMPKVLEIALHNGVDPRTGEQLGPQTGDPATFRSFDELFAAYEAQLRHFIDIKVRGNNVIERLYAHYLPAPFLSLLTDDCIAQGKDYHDGGARYNTSYIQGVGLGTLTDCLSALKIHVFEQETIGMAELLAALRRRFRRGRAPAPDAPEPHPALRQRRRLRRRPDAAGVRGVLSGGRRPAQHQGRRYHINLLPTTCHVYFGSVIGATPDGRRAWRPLSEGVSPVQGADRCGPTAAVRSVSKMDHVRTGGTLLNQKLAPQLLKDDAGLDMLTKLVRSYFTLDGHHIQFNVVDAATLRAAKENPEQYRDLIVRVAGYSDYFCNLSEALQDEIIARTEHQTF